MNEVYYIGHNKASRGTVRMSYGGRPAWAFLAQCEDGLALLCKPAILYVSLVQYGEVRKVRVLRFKKQHSLNSWVSTHLSGLRSEGYNVHYMDRHPSVTD